MNDCSNCGNQLNKNDVYCGNCGHELQTASDATAMETSEETEYGSGSADLKQFVGKNWDYYNRKWTKMKGKESFTSTNFAAFFLTFFWLGYRKMYKSVFMIAGFYLAADLFLYFIGYQYGLNSFMSPADRVIGMVVYITLGLYGNYFYKKHAEKQLHLIEVTAMDRTEKDQLIKKKGGRSWLGVLFAVLIMASVYFIPAWFIPMNFNDVDIVKNNEFYEYPGITLEEMFDSLFDNSSWDHTESTDEHEVVTFTGEKKFDGETHDVTLHFALDEDTDESEIIFVSVDDEELDMYEGNLLIEDLFDEYEYSHE